ncbi:MAG: hypothetical protein ACREPN_05110 [Rudaea sp.]
MASAAAPGYTFENPYWFLLIALGLSLPLILNPGYFSHDELQWLAFADQPRLAQLPWNAWFDFSPFQYRPLTFNLWLLLSHWFGYQPMLMHLLRVLFGVAAAALLRDVLTSFEVTPRRAALACWIFLLTPYAIYTDAWIASFGDSLCLIFLLLALRYVLVQPGQAITFAQAAVRALPVAALAALALMSKESAIIFPAVLLIAAVRRCDRTVAASIVAAACIVAIYLCLRMQTILYPAHAAAGYAWSLANIPQRLAEYAVFPFLVGHFEVIAARTHLTNTGALICLALLLAAMADAGWRRFCVWVLGFAAALGPVLILDLSANQYAYLASAWLCAFVAWTWPRLTRPARILLVVPVLVVLVHGYQQTREIRHIGRIQQHLYQDLPRVLAHADSPIRIKTQRRRDDFILHRLLHDIPSYRHMPIGNRVIVIAFAQDLPKPDFVMAGDGHLHASR